MKIRYIFALITLVLVLNNSWSNEIKFYLDNKYISYEDKFISEFAIKYNKEINNFGITLIGRALNRKSDYINAILYYDNDFNRIEIGNYESISSVLQAGIPNITKTLNDNDYIFELSGVNNLISRPNLLTNQNFGYFDDITNFNKTRHRAKVNYILNFTDNLSFGLTFIDKYKISKKNKYIYNIYEYGINYYNKLGELNFNLSFMGESNFKGDMKSHDFGIDFNYYGILFGGNYGVGKNIDRQRYSYYSYGIGYEIKSLTVSLWYFNGDYEFNDSTNFSVSYNINKYITVYSEINHFRINNDSNNSISFGITIRN